MPETVFINKADGKIELMTALDRDRCLTLDTKTRLTDPIKVREKLQAVTYERRKDCEQFGKQKYLEERNQAPKAASTLIQTLKRPDTLSRKQQQVSNRTGLENKALAIVKYRGDRNPHKPVAFLQEVVQDAVLQRIMDDKSSGFHKDSALSQVEYI